MAKGRTWTSEEKARIVLHGLKRRSIAELCNEYQIHQTRYYKWRDRFLSDAPKLFDTAQQSKKEERMAREAQKLKGVIGELTVELKKAIAKRSTPASRADSSCRCRLVASDSRVES